MRIVVTRPEGQEGDLVARLERLGHDVIHCPLIAIEPLGDSPIDVSGYDWIVVTSANGARELLRRASGTMPQTAAIGAATAEALGRADLVPAVATQEGLLAELPRPAGRVLFAAGEGARRVLPDALGADVVTLYRTRELRRAELPPPMCTCWPPLRPRGRSAPHGDGPPGRLDRPGDVACSASGRPGRRRGGCGPLECGARRRRRRAARATVPLRGTGL